VRKSSLWRRLLGVQQTVIEGVEFEAQGETIVVQVRPRWDRRGRCGICRRRSPGYDQGEGRRRWRGLDLGTVQVFLEAQSPRVTCREHGVVVAGVPWARHGARFTRDFEDQVSWLVTRASKSAVAQLFRVTWRSVGRILERVCREAKQGADLFAGLRRIGVDEVSYRKGQKYLTVVVDHDSGRVIWVQAGRDKATLRAFFDLLGTERSEGLELVSADGAAWIRTVVKERCPNAKLCLDPFHIVSWATDAVDVVRRELWQDAKRSEDSAGAKLFKGLRFVLWRNPEDLSEKQSRSLAEIPRINDKLYRAYLLKELLREVFKLRGDEAMEVLHGWLSWARRCRIAPFVKLARTIKDRLADIEATLRHGLSNARLESTNTRIRLLTRMAFGFHSAESLIALVMLSMGGLCPALPGRA
jgi:transposase